MFNEKMLGLGKQSSAIRKLFEYGKIRKKEIGEDNVFDFSIGNPNVKTPDFVNEKLIEIIKNTDPVSLHGYTSASGNMKTRDAIAEYLNKTYGCNEQGKYIYLTLGAAASLSIAFNALLNEGDEVIVFTPFWPEYKVLAENAKGKMVFVNSDDKFYPDFNDFENKITNKTKIVIINSPNNPTGVIYDEKVIEKIASIMNVKQKEYGHNIYLLSDEPYRELVYNNQKYPFVTNYYDNSLVAYSFSKSLSLPGERVGYLLVSSKMNNKDDVFACVCGSGRSLGFVCASSLFQELIPHVLGITSDLSVYKENRELLYNSLVSLGYDVIYPSGAFYMFVKALEEDDEAFSNVAKQEELLLVPSASFGIKGYVRISYCVANKTIKDSLPAFKRLMDRYKGE